MATFELNTIFGQFSKLFLREELWIKVSLILLIYNNIFEPILTISGSPLLTLVLREKFLSSLFSLVPSSSLFFFYSGRKYGSEFEMLLPSS